MSNEIEKTKALVKINPLADPDYIALQTEIGNICMSIESHPVNTENDVIKVTEDVNLAQKVSTTCEKLRLTYKDPLTKYGKSIDASFKTLSEPIAKARGVASQNIAEYNRKQREAQRLIDEENARIAREAMEMQRLIDEENERLRKEAEESGNRTLDDDTGEIIEAVTVELIPPEPEPEFIAPAVIISKASTGTGSATETMVPRYELIDIKKVPSNLILLNEKAINAMLKAGIRDIEGLRIWEEPEIKFRSR